MKINSINSIQYKPLSNTKSKNSISNSISFKNNELKEDTFLSGIRCAVYSKKNIEALEKFEHGKGKVTKQDYEELRSRNTRLLNMAKNAFKFSCPNTPVKSYVKASVLLKNLFDNQFGKNKYTVISLGTSPAPICDIMSHLGVDTIFAPLSGVGVSLYEMLLDPRKDIAEDYKRNTDIILDYLSQKGINKNTDKELVVLDYTYTGKSLKIFCKLMRSGLDIPSDKIHSVSVMKALARNLGENIDTMKLNYQDLVAIENELLVQRAEQYVNVPHFYIDDKINKDKGYGNISSENKTKEEVFREFEEFSKPDGRLYSICFLDELKKKNIPFTGKIKYENIKY